MMTAEQQVHYHTIATELAQAAPDGWKKAWVQTRIGEHADSESTFDWVDGSGKESWFDPPAGSVATIGRAMRDLHRTWPSERWQSATLTLQPDGQFKFDVSYHD